jgi:filamentous hemagglutinin
MAQFVIDTGEFPNDGTGDPLRTAFEYVNLNFDQIFAAGPVLSNIEIINNTIYSINTNGNIVLNPNGIGNVIANAHVIPDTANIRNLGAPDLKWNTVYAQYLVGDGNGISNVTVSTISNGSAQVDAYFNGNVAVSANGVANVAVFTVNGLVVPNTVQAGTVSGNIITTNISGQSITISATGNNQSISLAPNGTGNVSVNFKHIVNLAEPVNPQDAATKFYVDTVAEGLDVKASCLLATTAGLPAYIYNNGSAGVGATITGNAVGLLSIDSTAVTAGARVLVKNESGANDPYNGIYVVVNTGNASVAFNLIRSTDFDNGAPSGEIPGAFTFIETGTVNADSGWVCTTNNPVTMGVTPIYWSQFSGAGSYMAGLGLNLVGSVFNVLVDNNTTEINLNNQVVVKPNANLVTPNIGAATGTSLSVSGALSANTINISGAISTTANISGGNLLTAGVVSAAGNITGGNIASLGFITASGNIISASNILGANLSTSGTVSAVGNIQGGNLVAVANIVSGNLLTTGVVSAAGNITGGNIATAGTVSATGNITSGANITGGNVSTSGTVSAVGNIQGANLVAVSNVTGGNLSISGQISAGGNILFGAGDISGTGNIYANKIFANIQGNIDAAGNLYEVQFNTIGDQLGASANFTYNSVNNILTVINGNIVGGNLLTTGVVSAAGNITGGNIATAGFVTATGEITSAANIIGANFNTSGKISATGNVQGGNIVTVGNVTGGNLLTDGAVSATGNIVGNNVSAANTITALTANVSGNIESGNIINSGIITATGNVIGGNIRTAGQITATGNLTVGNVRTAGLVSAGGEILANGNISGSNITANGIVTASGNIISNQYFIGNGAFLTGIDATLISNGNSNVQVLANSNVTVGIAGTANLAVFANTGLYLNGVVSATGKITSANVETGNVTAGNILSNNLIGSNVIISSTGNITLGTTGNINVGNTYITNLANPVNLQDAATKFYVDTVATGLDPKESVVYATAAPLGVPYTYNNGASGVGATLTANLPGALTIDGNLVQSGQRVLIKNETGTFVSNTQPSAAFNGIYDVAVAGNVSTAWSLTRSADFNQPSEMVSSFTFVEEGGTNADTGWVCVTNNPITVGFTPITFTQFSGAGTFTAGNGLSLNGTVFNVNTDGNIAINGNNQVSIANSAVLNSPNITTATATSLSATGNVTAGNILFGTGIVSGTGNIYADKIFANIVGNVDAAGNLTEIQFNSAGDQLGASANFTYNSGQQCIDSGQWQHCRR